MRAYWLLTSPWKSTDEYSYVQVRILFLATLAVLKCSHVKISFAGDKGFEDGFSKIIIYSVAMFTILFTFAFVFTRSFCSHFNIYALFFSHPSFPIVPTIKYFSQCLFPCPHPPALRLSSLSSPSPLPLTSAFLLSLRSSVCCWRLIKFSG